MLFEEIHGLLVQLVDAHGSIYLVGGCVRDAKLNQTSPDFDLIFEFDAITAGRTIADFFQGDFFVLDPRRGTGRALFLHNGNKYKIDCALLNPLGINEDLKNRDFTINAMAVKVPELSELIDPLGGSKDLENHILRLCNPDGFFQDPVRVIRAVRFSINLDLEMDVELVLHLKKAIEQLADVSCERIRDEIINILNTKSVKESVQLINNLGLLDYVFPGMQELISLEKTPPHVHNGWDHTLEVVRYCQTFIDALQEDQDRSYGPMISDALKVFKKYEKGMREVLSHWINPFRDIKALLYIAALYHDTGKPFVSPIQKNERTNFPDHEKLGENIVKDFCINMAFSNLECQFIRQLVAGHMLPTTIKTTVQKEFRRSAYQFFKQTDLAGVLICVMHLADVLATYQQTISPGRWQIALETTENLLDIWFHHQDDVVDPPKLIDGLELQKEFGIPPGRRMGEILECLREEQAAGDVSEVWQAHQFIRYVLDGGY